MAARPVALLLLVLVSGGLAASSSAGATQFKVGGQNGWSVPAAGAESYNTWAGRLRFQIGDQLRKLPCLATAAHALRHQHQLLLMHCPSLLPSLGNGADVCMRLQCSCTPRRRTRCC
jgi:hypothetical protein